MHAVVADDPIVIAGTTPDVVQRTLQDAHIVDTGRHGKQLWLALADRPAVLFHFGMTGGFRTLGDEPLKLETQAGAVDRAWPPRFTKLRVVLDDGGEIAFVNARRLGRVRLRDDPRREPPISTLGYDPLNTLPSPDRFARLIGRRRSKLKVLLLDQTFAAGVGNWIADEVLYQSRLAPQRGVDTLDRDERDRLRLAVRRVIKTAVRANAHKDEFPRGWLFHRRWGRDEGARTAAGEAIVFDTIGGRTTAWVPSVQR